MGRAGGPGRWARPMGNMKLLDHRGLDKLKTTFYQRYKAVGRLSKQTNLSHCAIGMTTWLRTLGTTNRLRRRNLRNKRALIFVHATVRVRCHHEPEQAPCSRTLLFLSLCRIEPRQAWPYTQRGHARQVLLRSEYPKLDKPWIKQDTTNGLCHAWLHCDGINTMELVRTIKYYSFSKVLSRFCFLMTSGKFTVKP